MVRGARGSGWREGGISLSALEADVAYFDARLALLPDECASGYQVAQRMVYGELRRVLSDMLQRLRGEGEVIGKGEIVVEEVPGDGWP